MPARQRTVDGVAVTRAARRQAPSMAVANPSGVVTNIKSNAKAAASSHRAHPESVEAEQRRSRSRGLSPDCANHAATVPRRSTPRVARRPAAAPSAVCTSGMRGDTNADWLVAQEDTADATHRKMADLGLPLSHERGPSVAATQVLMESSCLPRKLNNPTLSANTSKHEQTRWEQLLGLVIDAEQQWDETKRERASVEEQSRAFENTMSAAEKQAAQAHEQAEAWCREAREQSAIAERRAEEIVAVAKSGAATRLREARQRLAEAKLMAEAISKASKDDPLSHIRALEDMAEEAEMHKEQALREAIEEHNTLGYEQIARLAMAEQAAARAASQRRCADEKLAAARKILKEVAAREHIQLQADCKSHEERVAVSKKALDFAVARAQAEAAQAEACALAAEAKASAGVNGKKRAQEQRVMALKRGASQRRREHDDQLECRKVEVQKAVERADAGESKCESAIRAAFEAAAMQVKIAFQHLEETKHHMARILHDTGISCESRAALAAEQECEQRTIWVDELASAEETRDHVAVQRLAAAIDSETKARQAVLDADAMVSEAALAEHATADACKQADMRNDRALRRCAETVAQAKATSQQLIDAALLQERRAMDAAKTMDSYASSMLRETAELKDNSVAAAQSRLDAIEKDAAAQTWEVRAKVDTELDSLAREQIDDAKMLSCVQVESAEKLAKAEERFQAATQLAHERRESEQAELNAILKAAQRAEDLKNTAEQEAARAEAVRKAESRTAALSINRLEQKKMEHERMRKACAQQEAICREQARDRIEATKTEMDMRISEAQRTADDARSLTIELEERAKRAEQFVASLQSSHEEKVENMWREALERISAQESKASERERSVADMHEWTFKGQTALLNYYKAMLSETLSSTKREVDYAAEGCSASELEVPPVPMGVDDEELQQALTTPPRRGWGFLRESVRKSLYHRQAPPVK